MNAHVRKISISELEKEYVFNDSRNKLYHYLLMEIEYMKQFTEVLRLGIYGSFITDKPVPNDIDIIVGGSLNEAGRELIIKDRRISNKNRDFVHRKSYFPADGENCLDTVIDEFNNKGENLEKGIEIKNYIELIID